MFTLSFKTENAEFDEDRPEAILAVLRDGVSLNSAIYDNARCFGNIYDSNGNTIGRWIFEPDGEGNSR